MRSSTACSAACWVPVPRASAVLMIAAARVCAVAVNSALSSPLPNAKKMPAATSKRVATAAAHMTRPRWRRRVPGVVIGGGVGSHSPSAGLVPVDDADGTASAEGGVMVGASSIAATSTLPVSVSGGLLGLGGSGVTKKRVAGPDFS